MQEKNLDDIFKYFTRSLLKKSIMTVEYSVTLKTFLDYFEKELKNVISEKEGASKESINKTIMNVRPFIMAFYYFCKNFDNLDEHLSLKTNNKEFSLMLENLGYEITHFDGFRVPLAVFKKSKKEERIIC